MTEVPNEIPQTPETSEIPETPESTEHHVPEPPPEAVTEPELEPPLPPDPLSMPPPNRVGRF